MKKGILFLALLFGFCQITPVLGSELTDDYLDIATNYFNANNFAKALEYINSITALEPDNAQAKELKDKILPPNQDEAPTAQDTAKVLSTQNPENFVILDIPQADVEKMTYDADYYNKKGQEFYDKKDYNMAIEYFYKSLNLCKKNPNVYNNLGMAYWAKNNSPVAIKYFKKASWMNRNYTQPLVNLAGLYEQLSDENSQFYYLQKAIKSNGNDYLAYYKLGEYYKKKMQYPNAITNYKEAVKINPKYSPVYMSLAISFFETEEFNYALISLKQYLELCPTSDYAYYLMARTSLAMSHYADAKTDIEKAIELCNKDEYQFELGKIDYYLEDYKTALDIFQTQLATQDSAELFNYVGLCNYKLRNIELAIINFNNAIKSDGLRPIYYYNLAQCYKSLGDKKNYVKYVTTATKITPINYQDFIDLSYIYYDNGNPGYAINTLNNAITKYPSVKSLYLSKLKIYETLSDNLHYNETRDLIEKRFNKQ